MSPRHVPQLLIRRMPEPVLNAIGAAFFFAALGVFICLCHVLEAAP